MNNDSVATDYPVQQARLRKLLKEYQSIGETGIFGVMMIEGALATAEQAIATGDVIEILLAWQAMVDITG
jgi:hypothetical protein